MPFRARNARYLRVSDHTILLLYIYLDDRHVEWMSDYTLQRVLEDLRPVIGPKLREEHTSSTAKTAPVSVHRGDTYQFAFFFRKNEPHAVLVKTRDFSPVSAPTPLHSIFQQPESVAQKHSNKRKRKKGKTATSSSVRRQRLDSVETECSIDEVADNSKDEESQRPRQSKNRNYQEVNDGDEVEDSGDLTLKNNNQNEVEDPEDDDIFSESSHVSPPGLNIDGEDMEEEKPKMAMKVTYQGFTVYDQCLCVVVEPWPPLRAGTHAPSASPMIHRFPSQVPSGPSPVSLRRERTPLFLPEIDRRSVTPAPLPSRILPAVPLFDDISDDHEQEENEGGMLAFSQALSSMLDDRVGSADEDENEGDAFLGDADERRGGL